MKTFMEFLDNTGAPTVASKIDNDAKLSLPAVSEKAKALVEKVKKTPADHLNTRKDRGGTV